MDPSGSQKEEEGSSRLSTDHREILVFLLSSPITALVTAMSLEDHPTYVNQIKGWLQVCDTHHDSTCVPLPISQRLPEQVPDWVIDTDERCIVPGTSAHRYVALSYTWPESENTSKPLQLDRNSLNQFRERGCLSRTQMLVALPKVIKDAVELTGRIGERYLWVDRLCIIQDDAKTLSKVLRMDDIYREAYLTIIAAATLGLYGLSASGSHTNHTRYDDPNKAERYTLMEEHYENLSKSKWATRGWTYQEQILCRRAVFFQNMEIFWNCERSIWDQRGLKPGTDDESILSNSSKIGQRIASLRQPDFGFFVELVCPYNGRDFSYPQDALSAFSGILNALSPAFPGGFVCGLPRMFLDEALIWQPFAKATRRMDRSRNPHATSTTSSLPSWSWCGWQCLVDPYSLRNDLNYSSRDKCNELAGSWQTQKLVEWHAVQRHGKDIDSIQEPSELGGCVNPEHENTTSDANERATASERQTPRRNQNSGCIWAIFGPCAGRRRGREKKKDPPNLGPGAPFIGAQSGSDGAHSTGSDTPVGTSYSLQNDSHSTTLLTFSTSRAFFQPGALLEKKRGIQKYAVNKISVFEQPEFIRGPRMGDEPSVLVLQDGCNEPTGLLRLMGNEPVNFDGHIELIAISTGSVKRSDFEGASYEGTVYYKECVKWDNSILLIFYTATEIHKDFQLPELGKRGTLMEKYCSTGTKSDRKGKDGEGAADKDPEKICYFYNVLWIERRDGIAYRRACGHVPRDIWEANASEPIDIILG